MAWYEGIFEALESLKNEEQSKKMSAYMQNKFYFLGIPKPLLKKTEKPYLKESKKYALDWHFVTMCWQKEYREAQYLAIDYLNQHVKKLERTDLPKLKELILQKSWWETADSIDSLAGSIVLQHQELEGEMLEWSVSEHMWLRRVAINFQQEYKEKTNTGLLEKIIVNNLGSTEFFINKAIGWSLRDYSKINSDWVRDFLYKYNDRLNKLSIKEAGKYIE